jgi:hypothetical protein
MLLMTEIKIVFMLALYYMNQWIIANNHHLSWHRWGNVYLHVLKKIKKQNVTYLLLATTA